MELYLRTMLRQVDSSLLDEWEKMRDPDYQPFAREAAGAELRPPGAEEADADVTRDTKAFTAAIRNRIFTFLRAWSTGDDAGGAGRARRAAGRGRRRPGRPSACAGARTPTAPSTSASASTRRPGTCGTPTWSPRRTAGRWRVQQMLVDPEMDNDWVAEFDVDLEASRAAGQPVLRLSRLAALA